MKYTLVINFGSFSGSGGIQQNAFNLMRFMSTEGARVIWLKNKHSLIGDSYKSIGSQLKIEIINVEDNHLFWFRHQDVQFEEGENIVVLSYTIIDMLKALTLKREYHQNNITCLYIVPDTKGKYYFIEEYFKGWLCKYVFKRIRKILIEWNNSHLIHFFDPQQILAFEHHYNIQIDDAAFHVFKGVFSPPPMDLKLLDERSARRGNFNIVTVGRFDFPHKGYMLGLVRAYARLKQKYQNLTLTYIGYGCHESVLREEISKIPRILQRDISIIGEVPHEQLENHFKDKHLSVAVAGAAIDAACFGVLSVVARNHCPGECEAYGFLPENRSMIVSSSKGVLVDGFIEEALEMPDDEYIKRCKNAYEFEKNNIDPWHCFKIAQKCPTYSISRNDLFFFVALNYFRKILLLINRFF